MVLNKKEEFESLHFWGPFILSFVYVLVFSDDVCMNNSGILVSVSNVACFPACETY